MTAAASNELVESILKDAERLQSFVIDEIALRELLRKAWKPVGKAIKKQLSEVIDFKNGSYSREKSIRLGAWLTDTMYDGTLRQVWKKIAPTARKYIEKAYNRGIDADGEPLTRKSQSVAKAVSSIYASRRDEAVNYLTSMVEGSFTGYASGVVVPAYNETVQKMGKLNALVQAYENLHSRPLDDDAKELMSYEIERRMMVEAARKAELAFIRKLEGKVDNHGKADIAANLAAARAHNFAMLDWMQENGIEYYQINATLDNKTCVSCSIMDGSVHKVSDALAYRDKLYECGNDTALLKEHTPFLNTKNLLETEAADLTPFMSDEQRRYALAETAQNDSASIEGLATGDEYAWSLDKAVSYLEPWGGWDNADDEDLVYTKEEVEEIKNLPYWGTKNPAYYHAKYGMDDASDDLKDMYLVDNWKKSLPKEQTAALKKYSYGSDAKINGALRGSGEMTTALENLVKNIDASMTYSLPHNAITYRGVKISDFSLSAILDDVQSLKDAKDISEIVKSKVGKDFVLDKGYLSTSLSLATALGFSEEDKNDNFLMMKLHINEGTKVAPMLKGVSKCPDEAEILIGRGKKIRLMSLNKVKNGFFMEALVVD